VDLSTISSSPSSRCRAVGDKCVNIRVSYLSESLVVSQLNAVGVFEPAVHRPPGYLEPTCCELLRAEVVENECFESHVYKLNTSRVANALVCRYICEDMTKKCNVANFWRHL
jgi:hypothetical protein